MWKVMRPVNASHPQSVFYMPCLHVKERVWEKKPNAGLGCFRCFLLLLNWTTVFRAEDHLLTGSVIFCIHSNTIYTWNMAKALDFTNSFLKALGSVCSQCEWIRILEPHSHSYSFLFNTLILRRELKSMLKMVSKWQNVTTLFFKRETIYWKDLKMHSRVKGDRGGWVKVVWSLTLTP